MRSHYKRIGDYVTQIKLKNTDDSISSLKGININKHFMPSVANINGTDLSKYRVVKKNQFAFNPMHVGRDEVLPISLLEDDEPIIVSPAYVVFEVNDEEELLPAYMMMWCRRSEFDRNAWFMTDNSVRGGFSWADFCDMKLPVPSIEKQREIVREYNVVNDRISLNEQLTQKLEDTVQTIHKQWFVDFEFPISREYAEFIGNPELEGKPYKSSGGEMEMCDNLQSLIPKNWHTVVLGDIAVEKKEAFKLLNDFKIVSYIGLEHMPKKSISLRYWENISSIGSNKSKFTEGSILFGKLRPYFHKVGVAFVDGICSTDIIVCQPKGANLFGLVLTVMSSVSFVDYSNSGWSGTKMPRTSWNFMADYRVTIPKKAQLLEHFNNVVSVQTNYLKSLAFENRALGEFVEIINTKMSKA